MIKALLRKALRIIEHIQFAHLLQFNETLRNKHHGQKAFLFATGTSILGLDLSKFNGEVTIGCNDIFRHPSFSSFDLKYYVCGVPFRRWRQLGPRFTHEHHHQYFANIDAAFRHKHTTHLYHATILKYLEKRGLLSRASRYYFLRKSSLEDAAEQVIDLTKPGTFCDGGLTIMIALAIYMGCKEIHLFGCGYTYSPVQAFHFYNCMRCSQKLNSIERDVMMNSFRLTHPEAGFSQMEATNIRLNDKEFLVDFSYYKNMEVGHVDDFYKTHRIILKFAESNGVRIYNVVPAGYDSPVYKKDLTNYV